MPASDIRHRLSPKKLLLSKWTAIMPRWKEKHFMVTKVVEPEVVGGRIELVELEAVYSKRVRVIPWRELQDSAKWQRGWVRSTSERVGRFRAREAPSDRAEDVQVRLAPLSDPHRDPYEWPPGVDSERE